MRLFFDSSALAKRYVYEEGTEKVLEYCQKATEICLSVLCIPEVVSALNRLKSEKKISSSQYQNLKHHFTLDLEEVSLFEVTTSVLQKSIRCLEKASLRTLDAIQLASALEVEPDYFISADKRQSKGALQMGLKVLEV